MSKKLIDKLSAEEMEKIEHARRLGRQSVDVQVYNEKTKKFETVFVNPFDFE